MKRQAMRACALLALMTWQGIPEMHAQQAQPAMYNVPMAEYPKVDAQGRAMFRLKAPEAQSVVADICAGSGTTAVAALNTGRRFICFENAPVFYGPATERIEQARLAVAGGGKGV